MTIRESQEAGPQPRYPRASAHAVALAGAPRHSFTHTCVHRFQSGCCMLAQKCTLCDTCPPPYAPTAPRTSALTHTRVFADPGTYARTHPTHLLHTHMQHCVHASECPRRAVPGEGKEGQREQKGMGTGVEGWLGRKNGGLGGGVKRGREEN